MKYVYTVWFRDVATTEDDPDREWPACFLVAAEEESAARAWGDHLSLGYAARTGLEPIRSEAQTTEDCGQGWESLPLIIAGQSATDDEIGW